MKGFTTTTESTRPSIPATIKRRRLLRAAALAPAVPIEAAFPSAPSPTVAPSAPGFHLSDPLPAAWEVWRGQTNGDTISGLIELPQIEASVRTHFNALDAMRIDAHNAYLRQWGDESREEVRAIQHANEAMLVAIGDQAFNLGYAIAMTREQAPYGPEVWYQAAITYAGIVEMSEAEEQTTDDWRNTIVDENWDLLGWQKVDPAAQAGPVHSALDLARLAGWDPRPADGETST